MKPRHRFTLLLLFCAMAGIAGCDRNDDNERKITDRKEYTLTVASKKLSGTIFSCGNSVDAEVYAVKKATAPQWEPLAVIGGFDYEPGYEYLIRICETSYLDYRMGEPAWTEYELLELLSREQKESEGLPESFLPAGK